MQVSRLPQIRAVDMWETFPRRPKEEVAELFREWKLNAYKTREELGLGTLLWERDVLNIVE